MTPEPNQTGIEQKQKLLKQHQRNLNYLEQQAAKYGVDVPLAIHNALTVEREAIAAIERDLATLGISVQSKAKWQALVVEADSHWREIIAKNIGQLGGVVIEHRSLPKHEAQEIIETSTVVIVGVPNQPQTEGPTRQWVENVVKLGHRLPIILLVCRDNKDAAISLRQAICAGQTNVTPVTIFKENFDPSWFSRVVHKILTH